MSYLVAIAFDDPEEAGKVRHTLRSIQDTGHLSLNDSAVVVKDEDGKVHLKDEIDRGVKVGAVGGSVIGLLLASVFFPIAGIVVGALGGAPEVFRGDAGPAGPVLVILRHDRPDLFAPVRAHDLGPGMLIEDGDGAISNPP